MVICESYMHEFRVSKDITRKLPIISKEFIEYTPI